MGALTAGGDTFPAVSPDPLHAEQAAVQPVPSPPAELTWGPGLCALAPAGISSRQVWPVTSLFGFDCLREAVV